MSFDIYPFLSHPFSLHSCPFHPQVRHSWNLFITILFYQSLILHPIFQQVGTLTTASLTHCLCNHLTSFGGSFLIPPKQQLFYEEEVIIFVELIETQIIFYAVSGVGGLFLVCLFLASIADNRHKNKVRSLVLKGYKVMMKPNHFHWISEIWKWQAPRDNNNNKSALIKRRYNKMITALYKQ